MRTGTRNVTMTTESAVEDPRPLVTIAIPAYNEAKSLARCLASVLSNVKGSQPSAAVEILLLDDGSEDGTAALAGSLIGSRGRVISQPNRGRAASRRTLVNQARGTSILMLDAHVELGAGVLPWWLAARDRLTVLNGDVSVELNSPYAQFWDTLTTFGWREYLTNRRPVSFGLDEFDRFPKGTGMFLAPREVWLEAYADSGLDEASPGAVVSDDTRLLRALAAKHRIWLHPEFEGVYFSPRTSLSQFMSNARYRGETFVDSYWESPSVVGRATRSLPAAAAMALLVGGLASRRSRAASAALVAAAAIVPSVGVAAMAVAGGKPPTQAVVSASVAPAFALAFGAGLVRGHIAKSRRGRRSAPRRSAEGS
jgi:glycosyltransferase involved in cell wall biosynthesis